MALTSEDLQAIAALMDERMDKKLDEKLKPIYNKLEMLEIKHDVTTRKLEDINFRLTRLEYANKKELAKVNDEVETLIAVLEAKSILP